MTHADTHKTDVRREFPLIRQQILQSRSKSADLFRHTSVAAQRTVKQTDCRRVRSATVVASCFIPPLALPHYTAAAFSVWLGQCIVFDGVRNVLGLQAESFPIIINVQSAANVMQNMGHQTGSRKLIYSSHYTARTHGVKRIRKIK